MGDRTVRSPFRGIWIRARKMHPYLTRNRERTFPMQIVMKARRAVERLRVERKCARARFQSRVRRVYLPRVIKYRFAPRAGTLFGEANFSVARDVPRLLGRVQKATRFCKTRVALILGPTKQF